MKPKLQAAVLTVAIVPAGVSSWHLWSGFNSCSGRKHFLFYPNIFTYVNALPVCTSTYMCALCPHRPEEAALCLELEIIHVVGAGSWVLWWPLCHRRGLDTCRSEVMSSVNEPREKPQHWWVELVQARKLWVPPVTIHDGIRHWIWDLGVESRWPFCNSASFAFKWGWLVTIIL